MAEGVSRLQWAQTSAIIAAIANVNRNTKKKPSPFSPDDFDPWAREDRQRTAGRVQGDIATLKVFVQSE